MGRPGEQLIMVTYCDNALKLKGRQLIDARDHLWIESQAKSVTGL